jgi:hypothetical protein
MKKSLLVLAVLCFIISNPLESQGLLNKVKRAVSKEISGVAGDDSSKDSSKPGPEPACACDNAKLIMDLGKFLIAYEEITICTKDDGRILVYDKVGGKYYISKGGVSEGPYKEGDSKITGFCSDNAETDSEENADIWMTKYPAYISRSGEKYLIKFSGKNYGPYALINDFAVSMSKDKFAAIVTENMVVSEDQAKKMEEAMKNAKTDQERMDIAMKMSQQVQDQMINSGGPTSLQPKLVSNLPGVTNDLLKFGAGARLNGKAKLDDILVVSQDKIMDLQGNTSLKLTQNSYSVRYIFVNSSNTLYATYYSGTLTFSDNKTLAEVFNPYLIKTDGKVYLTYMYYSPGKDAVMQCAIPF